jgi:hypothetical protein
MNFGGERGRPERCAQVEEGRSVNRPFQGACRRLEECRDRLRQRTNLEQCIPVGFRRTAGADNVNLRTSTVKPSDRDYDPAKSNFRRMNATT